MSEIIFQVEPCVETGGYVARWDAPRGGGITTQGDSFAELDAMIADAVGVTSSRKNGPSASVCISPQTRFLPSRENSTRCQRR
ncbi:MAG: hypothetical protein ACLP2Y_07210 [Limisphaerales bacterium]